MMSDADTKILPASERKKESRKNLVSNFGPQVILNMSPGVNIRFRKICEHFGYPDMSSKTRHLAKGFNHSIAKIIDYYYITQVISPNNNDIKDLIKKFKIVWHYTYNKNTLNNTEFVLNKLEKNNHNRPKLIRNGRYKRINIINWTEKDINNMLDTDNILKIINENNKVKDE
ncbi:hypothetical protein [Providencia sp.]|uniref:hypothetical protein n=1 Tax=Providencia sp. TaxID=589 RepID=UPI0035B37E41